MSSRWRLVSLLIVMSLAACGVERAAPGSERITAAWGLISDSGTTVASLQAHSREVTGRRADIALRFAAMEDRPATLAGLGRLAADRERAGGPIEIVTLEPWSTLLPANNSSEQLRSLARGDDDSYLRQIGRLLARGTSPIMVRFAHEMNGDWYPWSGDPTTYVAAWRRVVDIIRSVAPQVEFVWAVNAADVPSDNNFESYWPGGYYVDALGVDGYNCLDGWRSPNDIFEDAVQRLRRLDNRLPVWITETASCEASELEGAPRGASKAAWIEQLAVTVSDLRVAGVVWFDRDKEFDWRIDSSVEAAAALREVLG